MQLNNSNVIIFFEYQLLLGLLTTFLSLFALGDKKKETEIFRILKTYTSLRGQTVH